MINLMQFLQIGFWAGITAFVIWLWDRVQAGKEAERQNRALRVLHETEQEADKLRDMDLKSVVDEFNSGEGSDSSKKGRDS